MAKSVKRTHIIMLQCVLGLVLVGTWFSINIAALDIDPTQALESSLGFLAFFVGGVMSRYVPGLMNAAGKIDRFARTNS